MTEHTESKEAVPLSREAKGRREKLLHAMPTLITKMESSVQQSVYGGWAAGEYCRSLDTLKELSKTFSQNEYQHDASIASFFLDQPVLCTEDGFLAQELIGRLSMFLSRGLPMLRFVFRSKKVALPPALELLHEMYNDPNLALDAGLVPQQAWFSPLAHLQGRPWKPRVRSRAD